MSSGPLVKAKIIERVWNYELMFYGKKITQLSEEELQVAQKLNEQLQNA